MTTDQKEFKILLDSINCCYAKDITDKLPTINDFPTDIFKGNNFDFTNLLSLIENNSNIFLKSVTLRMVAIYELRNNRDLGLNVDIKKIWNLINESILILPINATISSIGSQGFLSIPLFKYDIEMEKFDFIRLHIWDNSLSKYINLETCENFSRHTHSFYAESWIVCGKVINDRFKLDISDTTTDYSLFKVGYNKSLNDVNQHTSSANSTNTFVHINQISHETYMQGGSYVVKAGDFHRSGSGGENGLSATLFSFCAQKGKVDQSYVVGPSHITTSEINRKMQIDPTELLKRINKMVK
jgi:hypothetical protein